MDKLRLVSLFLVRRMTRLDSPINSNPDNFHVPLFVIMMLVGQTFLWRNLQLPWRN